ncbi:hypothetical protein IAT38_001060 [Cryptococcus sp. DSM 104549]
MLYIASALTPTPIIGTLRVTSLTAPDSISLVVAKPDRIEVWDVTETGLEWRAEIEMWGRIVGIEQTVVDDSQPHILVLLSPPQAHLLLVTFTSIPTPSLVVTSSLPLTPPTPTLRQAEFFTSVLAQKRLALVSLWVGVLSCIEIEVEKDKGGKKRRASVLGEEVVEKRLKFRDNFNINIREHNLLHLSFLPPTLAGPTLSFLWLSANNELNLQARTLSTAAHAFAPLSRPIDVVTPISSIPVDEDTDFNDIPFACPAARRVLPIPIDMPGGEKTLLVMGDEHSVLYSLAPVVPGNSPKSARRSSAVMGPATSPRASARRSPQNEMSSGNTKRRKSSMGGKNVSGEEGGDKWELKPVWRLRQGFGTVLAAAVLESHATGASALIGDECGRLIALGWEFERGQGGGQLGTVRVSKVDMGVASPPSSLTYLDTSHVFLSSAVGDSSLLRLDLDSSDAGTGSTNSLQTQPQAIPNKGKGRARANVESGAWEVVLEDQGKGALEVKESWMNVAPVKDFCTVNDTGGALSHIVMASGASVTNSLRVIRSGVGLEEIVNVEGLEEVDRMWSLTDASGTSRLLLSTSATTFLLQLEPDIAVIPAAPPISSMATLAAGLVPDDDLLVQVASHGVFLWADISAGKLVAGYDVGEETELVTAQVSGTLIVVANLGGGVSVLDVSKDGFKLLAATTLGKEISAVSIINLPDLESPIVAISTWTDGILLYTVSQLAAGDSSTPTAITEDFYATSLQLKASNRSSGTQLLAGLSDGSLVIYDLVNDGGSVVVSSRKTSSLGTRPLTLCSATVVSCGEEAIVSVGLTERMSVVFETKDRVETSSVNRKDIVAAAPIFSPSGTSLALFSRTSGLSFVKINSLKKLHVQTLDLGRRSAGKLANMDDLGVLGLGTTLRSLDQETGDVLQSSFVEIRDSTTLDPLAEIPLREREEVTALKSVFLLGNHYLAVGTGILPPDTTDDPTWDSGSLVAVKEGRLLLVEAKSESDEWKLDIITTLPTAGPVYDFAVIHGFLALAAGSKLSIHRLELHPTPRLPEASAFFSVFVASHLAVVPKPPTLLPSEDRLVLGDGMRSVMVLDVDEASGAIFDDQRDMATHGVVALGRVRDAGEGVVIADGHSNLTTFRLQEGLERAATFGLHEEITRFQSGSLVPPSSARDVISPDLLFASREGRLGVIGQLTPFAARTLGELQRNLCKAWNGPGDVGWMNWKRAGTELVKRDTVGFIDGDFVQKFLDPDFFSPSEGENIMSGGNSHEHVSKPGFDGKEPAVRSDVLRLLESAAGVH